jgi:hypothetical protein
MFYSSELPKVVGEFDAENLQSRIDSIVGDSTDMDVYSVSTALRKDIDPTAKNLDVAKIQWSRSFNPNHFNDYYCDNRLSVINFIDSNNPVEDLYSRHFDTSDQTKVLVFPDVLMATTKWPATFLVGKAAISLCDALKFSDFSFREFFWETDAGRSAIDESLQKGNLKPVKFEPNKVLLIPRGAIHGRDTPSDQGGYRYFTRQYPKFYLRNAGSLLGRISFSGKT